MPQTGASTLSLRNVHAVHAHAPLGCQNRLMRSLCYYNVILHAFRGLFSSCSDGPTAAQLVAIACSCLRMRLRKHRAPHACALPTARCERSARRRPLPQTASPRAPRPSLPPLRAQHQLSLLPLAPCPSRSTAWRTCSAATSAAGRASSQLGSRRVVGPVLRGAPATLAEPQRSCIPPCCIIAVVFHANPQLTRQVQRATKRCLGSSAAFSLRMERFCITFVAYEHGDAHF